MSSRIFRTRTLGSAALALILAAGCEEAPPSVEIAGGGFIFNYRLAEAFYGCVVKVDGDVPDGAVLVASFEDPAGGAPILVRKAVEDSRPRYKFETPPVSGVEAERPYRVTLQLVGPNDGRVLAEAQRTFSSNIAQSTLPPRPLTVGPGYHAPPPSDQRPE